MSARPTDSSRDIFRWTVVDSCYELDVIREFERRGQVILTTAKGLLRDRAREALHLLNGMAGEW